MKKIVICVSALILTTTLCSWDLKNALGTAQKVAETTQQVTDAANGVTETTTDALTAGTNAGKALSNLYSAYKANGKKLNTKDVTTYTNLMSLSSNALCLKDNITNTEFLKTYGQGLIAGSMNLVTESNVQSVTNSLVDMVANSETVQNGTQIAQDATATASSTLSAVNNIMNLFNTTKK